MNLEQHVTDKMTFLRALRRPSPRYTRFSCPNRGYANKASQNNAQQTSESEFHRSNRFTPRFIKFSVSAPLSSCPANTLLTGLNYLKGQPPVVALPDEEYPPWLWTLLQPVVDTDSGPGSLAEKRKMKAERTANIKYANFLKTQ